MEQFTPSGEPLVSPTHDYGIFQINRGWLPVARKMGLDVVHNPIDNVEFAYWLASTHGYSQWTTYRYCKGADEG